MRQRLENYKSNYFSGVGGLGGSPKVEVGGDALFRCGHLQHWGGGGGGGGGPKNKAVKMLY